ncbi:hypothetical protein JCGZ_25592 [Jatropha curcas]|uniref:Uncharacterized protein n=1 Tax=Jatropha curcas TaxID=180498 RepID=A0A067JK01_JATCU|nr:uncharacterized protein LOC105646751 [Jatropha curcas]KDP24296.1 hypothetical protein JCGZ_25592 [Jatropha curcas]
MNNITASEIAGLGVGTLLLCCAIAAPKIDSFISASQRSSLGMCKKCGDLRMIACSNCKGMGLIKERGPLSFNLIDDLYQSIGGESKVKTFKCSKCQATGRFCCPDCSKVPSVKL